MNQDGRVSPPGPGMEGEGREPLLYFYGGAGDREPPLETAVARNLDRLGAAPGCRLLVALSGGADSLALLAILVALGDRSLVACHVDHGMRPPEELARERELLVTTCAALGVALRVEELGRGQVAEHAARKGLGLEGAARALRYRALRAAAREEGASFIALAHHLDDQYETLLMRSLGGAGTAGLRGIPARRGPFVRPLLTRPKAELLGFLGGRGMPWSEDSSNAEERFLRNRLRLELLPLLDRIAPSWRGGLLATARRAGEDEAALAGLAPEFSSAEGGLELESGALLRLPRALRRRSLLQALGRLRAASRVGGPGPRGSGPEGSARMARAMTDAFLDAIETGKRAEAGEFRASTVEGEGGPRFRLELRLDFPRRHGYFVRVDGPGRVSARFGEKTLVLLAAWTDSASGLREGSFSFPLALRTRLPGDRLRTAQGHKALDELLAERGVPADGRDQVPLLEDEGGLVAVLFSAVGAGPDRRRHDADMPLPAQRFFRIRLKGAAKASWTSTTRIRPPSGDSNPAGPRAPLAAARPPSRSSSPSAS